MSLPTKSNPDRGAPAWSWLAGLQVALALALCGVWWGIVPDTPKLAPVDERLMGLDVPSALAAVEGSIARATSPRALRPRDERNLISFLSLSGHAAGLQPVSVRVTASDADPAVIDVVVELVGDPFGLPIFLATAERHKATAHLLGVVARADRGAPAESGALAELGVQAEIEVRLRYFRPVVVDVAWVGERIRRAAPGADRATPVLERAVQLAAWRQFDAQIPSREAERLVRSDGARRQLPAGLIRLRREGGQLRWTPDEVGL